MKIQWKIKNLALIMMAGVVLTGPAQLPKQAVHTVYAEEITPEEPEIKAAWNQEEQGWKYYDENGDALKNGEKTIDGKKYLFNQDGYLLTGFQYVGNNVYYFSTTGKTPKDGLGVKNTSSGWKTIGGKVYYFEKGKVASGWKTLNKQKFYFNTSKDLSKRGVLVTGFYKIGKNTYYFSPSGKTGTKGKMLKGWQTIKNKRYYFYSSGVMAKDTYIQQYQVTSSGALSNKAFKLQKKVKSVVAAKSKNKKSKSAKLKACYMYVVKGFSYKRSYSFKKVPSWEMDYAYTMLTKKKGNCYNYAATFAFLARELGYNAKAVTGKITAARGGFTPHSWVEIKMGKKTYLFDPEMQHAKGYNLYKKTYGSVGLTYKK